jgi:hypothetical protein
MNRLNVISNHVAQSAALGSVDCGSPPMPAGLVEALRGIRARRNFQPRVWINDKTKKLVRSRPIVSRLCFDVFFRTIT